jgi:hypothetical protein
LNPKFSLWKRVWFLSVTVEYLNVPVHLWSNVYLQGIAAATRYIRTYKVHLHPGGTSTPTRYSTPMYKVQLQHNTRSIYIHLRDASTPIHLRGTSTPMRYIYIQHIYIYRVHLHCTAIPSWNSLQIRPRTEGKYNVSTNTSDILVR